LRFDNRLLGRRRGFARSDNENKKQANMEWYFGHIQN
jgi:hypothetical protein